jgi:hypothetical protein
MARLEYRLSKAYLHYVSTMRYGYVNPYQTFNRLDPMEADNPRAGYHTLYDVPTEVAKADFLPTIFRKATADSIGNINKLMARLEYRLSKAYLHYVSTMRYGYVNPYQTFFCSYHF